MAPTEDEDADTPRQQWSNETEFVMSCIAMAVGLGNIWRFPFVAFDNGGGAFIIPYIIVLLLIAKPMYYLEVCIAQFVSGGPVQVWALVPALKGKLTAGSVKAVCASSNMLFPSYSSFDM